jgi:hypothetical protein
VLFAAMIRFVNRIVNKKHLTRFTIRNIFAFESTNDYLLRSEVDTNLSIKKHETKTGVRTVINSRKELL